MMEEERKELEEKVHDLGNAVMVTHFQMCRFREQYARIKEKYRQVKADHEKADYQLAMVDGRFKKIESGRGGRKAPALVLTKEQVLDIASKLGVEVGR